MLSKIKENLVYIPRKDKALADSLFRKRDFNALEILVRSNIKKLERNDSINKDVKINTIGELFTLMTLIQDYNPYPNEEEDGEGENYEYIIEDEEF